MKQLFIAILFAFSISFVQASPLDNMKQLSNDLTTCSAFYSIMSNMLADTAKVTADPKLAQEYEQMSALFFNTGVLSTSWALHLAELSSYSDKNYIKKVSQLMGIKINQITQEMKDNAKMNEYGQFSINFDNVVITKYGMSCKALLETPELVDFFSTEKTSL